jgi:hypothetical protein
MDKGGIAAGLEQREAHGIPMGEESPAGEAVAVARNPMAAAIVANVEVVGWANTQRSKVGHLEQPGLFHTV